METVIIMVGKAVSLALIANVAAGVPETLGADVGVRLGVDDCEGIVVVLDDGVGIELGDTATLLVELNDGILVMLGLLLGSAGLLEGATDLVALELTPDFEGVLLGVTD